MAYIPNTTVKPQLSTPNSFTNPYDGAVKTAMNGMFDKGIGVINKELTERASEQQALQKLRTEQFNAEYADDLKQSNLEYATLVSAGQASMDRDSYKQFAIDRFNKMVKDKQWYFADKVERATFEQKAYTQIMQSYDSFVSNDLKNVAQEQMQQLVANKMEGAIQQASDALASPEKILAPFNVEPTKLKNDKSAEKSSPANSSTTPNQEKQFNKESGVNQDNQTSQDYRAFASKIYEVNNHAKIDLYFKNNDINSLIKLEQELVKNTFFSKDQRKLLTDKINLSKQNIEGRVEAIQYLDTYKKTDGTPDIEAITKAIEQRADLDSDKQATVKAQLKRIAESQESDYQTQRTEIFNKLLEGGDSPDSILLNEGQVLRDKDKLLIRDYTKVTSSNYDLYNQLQQKIMRMEKVDLISEGVTHLTANDLNDLQKLKIGLKDNTEMQKQAFSINKLMEATFKRSNITDKTQQQDLYAMVLEEIRGKESVKGKILNSFEVSQLIKEFMQSVE